MTTKRLIILQAMLLVGLSAVFLLPKVPATQPTGVDLALPDYVDTMWIGKDAAISEGEYRVLGHDTSFARKLYTGPHREQLMATIVLSGQDMNTSIHRAEWCLRAQGWTITDSSVVAIPLDKPKNAVLKVKRLHNEHSVWKQTNVDYYWFVGHDDTTPSHLTRNLLDVRDRLFKGYNQRWAYVSVYALIPPASASDAEPEKRTDEIVRNFIKDLAPAILKPSVKLGS